MFCGFWKGSCPSIDTVVRGKRVKIGKLAWTKSIRKWQLFIGSPILTKHHVLSAGGQKVFRKEACCVDETLLAKLFNNSLIEAGPSIPWRLAHKDSDLKIDLTPPLQSGDSPQNHLTKRQDQRPKPIHNTELHTRTGTVTDLLQVIHHLPQDVLFPDQGWFVSSPASLVASVLRGMCDVSPDRS